MRIALVLPKDATYSHDKGIFKKSLRYAPLTLTTLASLVPQEDQVEIYDEGISSLPENLDADLIGISSVTATAKRAYELADQYRAKGKKVILGGVHPTLLPDEAKEHADSVATGFADLTFEQIISDFKNNCLKDFYHGEKNISLDNIPLPRRDLLDKGAYITANTVLASRGCPNGCDFCVIPKVWGNYHYHRPIESIINEIRTLNSKRILFLDPSLTEDVEYAKALFKALIPLKIKWAGLSTIRIADDLELLKLAQKSGCLGLLVGFESITQDALQSASKRFNNVNQYHQSINRFNSFGIKILGCFMFGFDTDDLDCFDRTVEFVTNSKIDIVRYSVFTPFPGTGVFDRLETEGRILSKDWSLYDNEHVVFQPKQMSVEQLRDGLIKAWKNTYTFNSIFKRNFRMNNLNPLVWAVNFGFRFYGRNLYRGLNAHES